MMLLDLGDWLCHDDLLADVYLVVFAEDWMTEEVKCLHSVLWIEHEALSQEVNELGRVVCAFKHLQGQKFAEL